MQLIILTMFAIFLVTASSTDETGDDLMLAGWKSQKWCQDFEYDCFYNFAHDNLLQLQFFYNFDHLFAYKIRTKFDLIYTRICWKNGTKITCILKFIQSSILPWKKPLVMVIIIQGFTVTQNSPQKNQPTVKLLLNPEAWCVSPMNAIYK